MMPRLLSGDDSWPIAHGHDLIRAERARQRRLADLPDLRYPVDELACSVCRA
jgi:hypothetical protein